ncbi:MAG: RNA 2',3'-cyclic phosphodiesterase [Candidatus Eremiobacteraeota bacterium]|nr:RNA 2',3'-cyclic phosphodiesterase [Candidatus Eremiobacteraeota bacterium]
MSAGGARRRRLFVGIELDRAAREACAAVGARLAQRGYAGRYEAAEKLHVTLAFLGYVEPQNVERIVAALDAASRGAASFSVTLDKLGAFPHERKPRVIYVGAREQGPAFRGLAQRVRAAYGAEGFAFAGDAVAHVTIARVKPPQRPLPLVDVSPITLQVERLTLFESLPDPAHRTSRYETVATAPFAQ